MKGFVIFGCFFFFQVSMLRDVDLLVYFLLSGSGCQSSVFHVCKLASRVSTLIMGLQWAYERHTGLYGQQLCADRFCSFTFHFFTYLPRQKPYLR